MQSLVHLKIKNVNRKLYQKITFLTNGHWFKSLSETSIHDWNDCNVLEISSHKTWLPVFVTVTNWVFNFVKLRLPTSRFVYLGSRKKGRKRSGTVPVSISDNRRCQLKYTWRASDIRFCEAMFIKQTIQTGGKGAFKRIHKLRRILNIYNLWKKK